MINWTEEYLVEKRYFFLFGILLIFVLLQSLFLLIKVPYADRTDEVASYILAVGKYSNYYDIYSKRSYPYGKLVDVQEYRDLFKVDKKFCFSKIAKDVAFSDVSPPLYYWFLHIWIVMTGGSVYLWTGHLLNLFIGMFVILLLFEIAVKLFNSIKDALFVSLIFSLSPPIYTSVFVRPHFLLLFITLLFIYFIIDFIMNNKKVNFLNTLLLSFLVCLGLLCRYEFLLICFAVLIFLLINFYRENKSLIIYFLLACVLGVILFCNIFPGFINNFINANNALKIITHDWLFGSSHFDLRATRFIENQLGDFFSEHQKYLLNFLLNSGQFFYYLFISMIGILYLIIWFSIKRNISFRFVFSLFFYPISLMSILYIFGKSFAWTCYESYYLFILPFFYLSLIFYLKAKLNRQKVIVLICLCQILFFSTLDNLISKSIANKNIHNAYLSFLAYCEELQAQEQFSPLSIILVKSTFDATSELKFAGPSRIFKIVYMFPAKSKIIIADDFNLLSNYSIYFGDNSKLNYFLFVAEIENLQKKDRTSNILLERIRNDKNLKFMPEFSLHAFFDTFYTVYMLSNRGSGDVYDIKLP